jgi:hypothetical protein
VKIYFTQLLIIKTDWTLCAQGEMLDQIEYSVQQAHAYVEKGVSQLEKAKTSQKSARKVRNCPCVLNKHCMDAFVRPRRIFAA